MAARADLREFHPQRWPLLELRPSARRGQRNLETYAQKRPSRVELPACVWWLLVCCSLTSGLCPIAAGSSATRALDKRDHHHTGALAPAEQPLATPAAAPDRSPEAIKPTRPEVSANSSSNATSAAAAGSGDEEPGADRFANRGFVYIAVAKFFGYILIFINYIYALVFIIGFGGNLSVMRLIFTKKYTSRLKLEKVTDCYIINLALADMMYVIDLPFIIVKNIYQSWIFNDVTCRLYMSSTSLNQFACSFLLIAMAFDRYLAICHSSRTEFRSLKAAVKICALIWFISIPLSIPIFTYANKVDNRCTIKWPDIPGIDMALIFTTYGFVMGFALPLLSIGYFYKSILRKLKSSRPTTIHTRNIEIRNKRVERLVWVIIWAYTICWSPYWICQFIISTVDSKYIDRMVYEVFVITTSLAYTNSAINPIIYTFWSNGFGRSCSCLGRLACFKACCQLQANSSANPTEETFAENNPTSVTDCRHSTLNRTNSSPQTNNNNNHQLQPNNNHGSKCRNCAPEVGSNSSVIRIEREAFNVNAPDNSL